MADLATKNMRKRIAKGGIIFAIAIAALAAVLLSWFFITRTSIILVQGKSMEPTFSHGDILILEQASQVELGMIVVFTKPEAWAYGGTEQPEMVKRIIAGGNSLLSYNGESLFVNNLEVYNLREENYPCELEPGYVHRLTKLELFVMGDNTHESLDALRIICDGNSQPGDAYIPYKRVISYGHVREVR